MHLINYPLCFEPLVIEKPWGKTAFPEWLRLLMPRRKRIGEIWLLSDREHEQTKVANGPLAGKTLAQLRHLDTEGLYGGQGDTAQRFPLLFKLLMTDDKLSVQVHPDDAYAKAHYPKDSGKNEMWYVLEAEPKAGTLLGFKQPMELEQFQEAIARNELEAILQGVEMRPDQAYWVPAGRIHGIGAGLVLAEIQENSDLTFRVYDYGRQAKDGSRKLHMEEALKTINFQDAENGLVQGHPLDRPEGTMTLLADDEHFWCEHWKCSSDYTCTGHDGFQVLMGVAGSGQLVFPQGYGELSKGRVWLIPAAAREWRVEPEGEMEFLRIWVAG
jgi:mannose-6-phosphate isomerase